MRGALFFGAFSAGSFSRSSAPFCFATARFKGMVHGELDGGSFPDSLARVVVRTSALLWCGYAFADVSFWLSSG